MTRGLGLAERLEGLGDAAACAEGRLPAEDVARARVVLEHAGERMSRGPELTVVALAGATGSGKSSIFNAFAGTGLSTVGARRPTTGEAHACVWSGEAAAEDGAADTLLDWLAIKRRHRRLGIEPELDGMVLLDLPDHDSTEIDHRVEVDRLADVVDLLVWVVDPQKYADAALHDRYLRPLAGYGSVMVLVLNHIDLLELAARRACVGDLGRLLREDGLGRVPVIATSARTGEGLGDLRAELARRVSARRAATERLAAEVDRTAVTLGASCAEPAGRGRRSPEPITSGDRAALVEALARAANVDLVVGAVGGAHKHRARAATGWPFTRWVRRLRPDPLARLHLKRGTTGGARTSLPAPTEVQRAAVGGAIRALAKEASEDLPAPWPALVRRAGTSHEGQLPDLLDRTVGAADVDAAGPPAWWRVASALQLLFAAIALTGFAWLALLFGFEWLQLPDPPTPEVARIPLPTLLLLGGLAAGLLLALIARALAHLGAKRRARSARRKLLEGVGGIADSRILEPIQAELAAYIALCGALRRARGGR
ncbi:MAG: 50S ribosome-binding GTPase [Actinomycetota bacterium]|nr:50S ribosome-binding GTPase [Actinomycetota bacterium]